MALQKAPRAKYPDEINRLDIIPLVVPTPGSGIVHLRRIFHAPPEEVLLPRLLHLHYEPGSVRRRASKVNPYALGLRGETRYLCGVVLYLLHSPLRREKHIQQVHKHILVPLVPEYRLESRIRQNINIPLDYQVPVANQSFLNHNVIFGGKYKAKENLHPRPCRLLNAGFSVFLCFLRIFIKFPFLKLLHQHPTPLSFQAEAKRTVLNKKSRHTPALSTNTYQWLFRRNYLDIIKEPPVGCTDAPLFLLDSDSGVFGYCCPCKIH